MVDALRFIGGKSIRRPALNMILNLRRCGLIVISEDTKLYGYLLTEDGRAFLNQAEGHYAKRLSQKFYFPPPGLTSSPAHSEELPDLREKPRHLCRGGCQEPRCIV